MSFTEFFWIGFFLGAVLELINMMLKDLRLNIPTRWGHFIMMFVYNWWGVARFMHTLYLMAFRVPTRRTLKEWWNTEVK